LKLDFYEQTGTSDDWVDGEGRRRDPVDVIIAADIICQADDAIAAANSIHDALKPGGRAYVILGDAKHRFGVDRFQGECQRVGLDISISNVADLYDGKLLDQNMYLTTGYVEGMTLTMFFIHKPIIKCNLQI
jgi:SAM-dependent methyltransferase